MRLGELIKKYMDERGVTYEKFGEMSKLSKGYISMLVRGKNPKTGKPPVPSISAYNNIANAMSMTLDDLFLSIDDAPVNIGSVTEEAPEAPRTEEARIVSGWMDSLPKEQREMIVDIVRTVARK